ncbi:trichohyalin-like [Xiphophorus couchianus]|uniref:trichohyalin-like n=1 Tax=Xiphophorus couchianus TaxID=32473 RepID=UPI0010171EEF|nr:trichohyalin-like [Xiphophorus couchianus]
MSHYTPRYRSGTMGPHARRGVQQNPQGRFPPAHPRIFHGEIQELSYALEMERAGRVEDNQKLAHLEAELEETKLQLKKQKALKETFINQAKEAKRELERLEKFSDPAFLNAAAIASKVHNDVKYMKKKNLQQDFEELKVAHLLSREAFVAEIQAERKKSLALQEELNQLQTSYEELRSQYEADDALLRQEAESQTYDEARLSEEQRLLENLRAEKDEMFQEMSQTITFLQGSEKHLQEELTQLKCSYNELNCRYERDVSGLKQDVDRYQEEVRHEKDANIERDNENLQLINKLRAEKEELLQKMSGEISIRQKREKQMLHELDQVHIFYEELKCRYERDIMDIQQQVETYEQKVKQEEAALSNKEKKVKLIQERKHSALKQEVEKLQQQVEQERKAHLEKTEEDKKLLDNMRAEKEELFLKMSGEITILQKREKQMLNELDQVHVSHEEIKRRFERDNMDLQQEVETYKQQVEQERKAHLEQSEEDKKLLDQLRAEYAILQEITTTENKILQDKERSAKAELENVSGLYMELNSRFETEVTALKHQAEKHQEELICVTNDLQRARDDLLLAETLRAEEEGFQQQPITVSQEKEENSQNQVKVLNQEVSSEEDLSGEPLPGSSTDPESSEETEVAGETILEDLDNPDGKKKKSKILFWKKVRNTLRWKKPKKKQTSEDNQERV